MEPVHPANPKLKETILPIAPCAIIDQPPIAAFADPAAQANQPQLGDGEHQQQACHPPWLRAA